MNVHFDGYLFYRRCISAYLIILCTPTVADLGFPKRGEPTPETDARTYYFTIFCQKLVKIKSLAHPLGSSTAHYDIKYLFAETSLVTTNRSEIKQSNNRIFAICLEPYSVKFSHKQVVLLWSLLNHGNHHLQSLLLSVDMYCSIDALIQSISMKL